MGKRIAAWIVLTCCGLTAVASALSADDYALAGRMHMCQWTPAGLADAHDIFLAGIEDANCPDCKTDRELTFLRAITEAAMLFVDHSDALDVGDFLELADGFGVARALDTLDGVRSRNSVEPIGPHPLLPERDPNHVRRALGESILPRLESILAELDSIEDAPTPFVMYVPPEETGLTGDLEIDYGDVLILRGLLLAYRGVLRAQMVCDEKPYVYEAASGRFELRETVGDGNLLIEWVRRLADWPMREADANSLGLIQQARRDWIEAITWYMDALEYIALEDNPTGADPQEDELTYIDGTNLPHLDVYVNVLVTLRSYLRWDMAGSEPIVTTRTYEVRDSKATPVGELTLVFESTRFEGSRGSLRLPDGDMMEVEWFGLVDGDTVGISLFCPGRQAEAWLEGEIDSARGIIARASLDVWGPCLSSAMPSEIPAWRVAFDDSSGR
ncbi:MAG TPA: hypothetical protein PLU87_06670 [Sedimentisphaerales bacterium]|nr:hypothetical protein [Sedimentisphaerales bacterium]HRS10535.1 hypothetical protein [Sedimentisphaerales bacterium]HRV47241.1 hypothetical protein [Sedimentisphaerales bacterium]